MVDIPKFRWQWCLPQHWGTWLALLFLYILNLFPAKWRYQLATIFAHYFVCHSFKRQKIAALNLSLCFPEKTQIELKEILRKYFIFQLTAIFDFASFLYKSKSTLEKFIKIKGQEHIDKTLANNKPVMILTVHTTCVDAGALGINLRYPLAGPYNRFKNPIIDWWILSARFRFGAFPFNRKNALKKILGYLDKNIPVYYIPDEDLGEESSIFLPFFKQNKATIAVLGKIALRKEAVIIPCSSWYCEKTYSYQVELFPPLENFPQNNIKQDSLKMNQVMEDLIKIHPAQYMWWMRLFATQPQGIKSPYKNKKLLQSTFQSFCNKGLHSSQ